MFGFYFQYLLIDLPTTFIGIPWTLDIISAALVSQDGSGQAFEARLALDILNLLTVRKLDRTNSD